MHTTPTTQTAAPVRVHVEDQETNGQCDQAVYQTHPESGEHVAEHGGELALCQLWYFVRRDIVVSFGTCYCGNEFGSDIWGARCRERFLMPGWFCSGLFVGPNPRGACHMGGGAEDTVRCRRMWWWG